MRANIAALPIKEVCGRCKGRLGWNRLSTGIFTFDLREQRTRPPRRSVVAKQADNDNWLVISHCVIQWNTIERGRKMV